MHTPGPWEVTPGGIVGKRVGNGSMDLICDLRESPFIDNIPYNLLLISADPDILEACKKIIQIAPELWGNDAEKWPKIFNRIEKAINKAEGGE